MLTTRGHLDSRTGKPATVYTPPECLTPCPTCNNGRSRETVGMMCQTCGTDYGTPARDVAGAAALTERQVQDIAVTITALNAGRIDGPQAIASIASQVEHIMTDANLLRTADDGDALRAGVEAPDAPAEGEPAEVSMKFADLWGADPSIAAPDAPATPVLDDADREALREWWDSESEGASAGSMLANLDAAVERIVAKHVTARERESAARALDEAAEVAATQCFCCRCDDDEPSPATDWLRARAEAVRRGE